MLLSDSNLEAMLKDVSFQARPGETTAIIGSTGSGKTTLVNLISGLIPCDSGKILIDRKNTKDINKIDFQKKKDNLERMF